MSIILKDIYGVNNGGFYECGLAETFDKTGFDVKWDSLKKK